MDDTISRQAAIDELDVGAELLRRVLNAADVVGAEREKYEWGLGLIESSISDIKELPSAEPEQDSKVSFWKERAKEYEDIILRLVTEQAKGIKLDSIEITGERIIFKKSQPEQKSGEWINRHYIFSDRYVDTKVCSNCLYEYSYDAETGITEANFCPNCGAQMDGGKAEYGEIYCGADMRVSGD